MKVICLIVALALSFASAQVFVATCNFVGTTANPGITGTATLVQATSTSTVVVSISVTGITVNVSQDHGIHIHANGDISDAAAVNVGGHYDPAVVAHGCPPGARHVGDMGNWAVDSTGAVNQNKTLDLISLNGANSVIGRAIVIHANTDDCVAVSSSSTRLGYCVIGIANTTAIGTNAAAVDPANVITSAYAKLTPTINANSTSWGEVWFLQPNGTGPTEVIARVWNISGYRGFHVHSFGQLSPDGSASGGHFNPFSQNHGIPNYARHAGDMGNIYYYDNSGTAWYHYINDNITLNGVNSIVGRTVAVHLLRDVCNPAALGSRIAHGVVGLKFVNNSAPVLDVAVPATQDPTDCVNFFATSAPANSATSAPATSNRVATSTNTAYSVAPILAFFAFLAMMMF